MDLIATFFVICIATSNFGISTSRSTFNVVDFGAAGDGHSDDSQAFLQAWKELCNTDGQAAVLEIPSRKFLLQHAEFRGPCKCIDVHIQVLGNIVAPNKSNAWKDCDANSCFCWLCFYDVAGLLIDGSGTIDGRGSAWWNKQLVQQKFGERPRAVYFHNCNNLRVRSISLVNSPKTHISVHNCSGVSISGIHINSPGDSPNTDGINIAFSTKVNILDSSIKSGDDCIAIIGGSSYINITRIACGPGHGISVGSLGEGGAQDQVEEVHVRNCSFSGTQNGARIKTFRGGSGYARRISFEQITLIASRNPIIIDQHYCNNSSNNCEEQLSTIDVSDVTYRGVQGTSADEQAITLDCSDKIGCINIKMEQINITSSVPGKETFAYCKNAHGTSTLTTPKVPCLSAV